MSTGILAGQAGAPAAPAAHDGPPPVSALRLVLVLGGAGALAGLLIALVYTATLPRIEAHRTLVLRQAIEEVLAGPARADTLWLANGALVDRAPADAAKLPRVYRGYDAGGRTTGYAITAGKAGFADQIDLLFGYDPAGRRVLGMKILSTKETPGLGDKIEKPPFTGQFPGRIAPLLGVKAGAGTGKGSEIEMITGATISSRTVIAAINDAVAQWQPLLDAQPGGSDARPR